ncbi:MAG: methionyl-tRNA formyltransferase [Actinomycetota bacterium]|nr:methionyl-tRNA formyltransferase [Actinomycetota bacterium]
MNIIFMGTPDFALPSLKALFESDHKIIAVVTNPDRPKGRGGVSLPSSVKTFALEKGLAILQPEILSDEIFKAKIVDLKPDLVVVVAFGQLIPVWLLALPPFGCVNVHGSLLPELRGAAPIQRAVMKGLSETGVTTMLMDEGLDTGEILTQVRTAIEPNETAGSLSKRLSVIGAGALMKTIEGLERGDLEPRAQDNELASLALKITKDEARIDWNRRANDVANLINALSPSPGAYAEFRGRRIKFWNAEALLEPDIKIPGKIMFFGKESSPLISCKRGSIRPILVQLEGKKKMSFEDFIRGQSIKEGEKLT